MGLIDSHTHLESFAHKGALKDILDRAKEAGVEAMITIGTSREDWRLYRELATAHPHVVRATVGLHPCAVEADWERAVDEIEAFWSETQPGLRPVALGECGLDRFHLP